MAAKVIRLNTSVPMDWIQAVRQLATPVGRSGRSGAASRHWLAPPSVNRIEPMKKVIASPRAPTALPYEVSGPATKHSEPSPKKTPIARVS